MSASPYLLTTIRSLKDYLSKTSVINSDDISARMFILQATNKIENFLNRRVRFQTHTEFYDGDGSNILYLKNKPNASVSSLIVDLQRNFSTDDALDTDNYYVDADSGQIVIQNADILFQAGGALRNVSLVPGSINSLAVASAFPISLKTIKIVYSAGWNDFKIDTNVNDTIEWNNGTAQSATLTAATYTGISLASHIQTQMNAEITATDPYTITYNQLTGKFKLASSESVFILKLFNGSNPEKTVGYSIGFDPAINISALSSKEWGLWIPANGTATTSVTTIVPSSSTGQIMIFNGSTSPNNEDLKISFDGGTNYFNVAPFVKAIFWTRTLSIKIKTNANTAPYFLAYTNEDGSSGEFDSDIGIIGIPEEIEHACIRLSALYYEQSQKGNLQDLGKSSINFTQGGTISFNKKEEQQILDSISRFRRMTVNGR